MQPNVVLASASPRRRALLAQLGVAFDVLVTDVDESQRDGESAVELVRRLAADKARWAADRRPEAVVLGADTLVAHRGTVLGKPEGRADARSMLEQMRGSTVDVISGVACAAPASDLQVVDVTARLYLRSYTDDEIDAYLATGEADDKAGALAVQGAASGLVERTVGSRSNVIGLPLAQTVALLRAAGVAVPSAPRPT